MRIEPSNDALLCVECSSDGQPRSHEIYVDSGLRLPQINEALLEGIRWNRLLLLFRSCSQDIITVQHARLQEKQTGLQSKNSRGLSGFGP